MSRQNDILKFCLEELLENSFLKSSFKRYVKTDLDRIGLNGGLNILRKRENQSPLISLMLLNRQDALKQHETLKYKVADISNDVFFHMGFSNTPNITPRMVAYGICADVMDRLEIEIENPNIQNALAEQQYLAEKGRVFLDKGGVDFDQIISDVRNLDDGQISQEEFFFEVRDLCLNRVQRAVNNLAGCNVFNKSSYTYRQNEKWRKDLFTKICEDLDEKYVGDVQALERDWEKNLRRAIREEFEAFEFLVSKNKEANPKGFYMPGFAEFIETPEWEEFCQAMRPKRHAAQILSIKSKEKSNCTSIKTPERGLFPVKRGGLKCIK